MLNSSIVISPLVLFSGKVNKAVRRTYHIFFANSRASSLRNPLQFYRKFVTQTTLRDKIEEIISFWTFRHISNASMEGFNNKIRWLIKQAYGFRDSEYFKLKIYQFPEISSVKEL